MTVKSKFATMSAMKNSAKEKKKASDEISNVNNTHPEYSDFVESWKKDATRTVKNEKGIETGYRENGDVAYTLDSKGKFTIYWDNEGKKPMRDYFPNGDHAEYREDGTLFYTTSHDGTASYYKGGKLHHSVDSEGNVTYSKNLVKETKNKDTSKKKMPESRLEEKPVGRTKMPVYPLRTGRE